MRTGWLFDPRVGVDRDRPALVAPAASGDRSISYGELVDRGAELLAPLEGRRSLLFIDGANSIDSLAAYAAALRHGHVVHLLDPGRADVTADLIGRYRPNAIVRSGRDITGSRVEIVNDEPAALHPDLAVLLSTSGSTGTHKLVKLSATNVVANTRSIVDYLDLRPTDRALTVLKPFYSYGFSVINTHLTVGGSLVLTDASVQDRELWNQVERHGVTNLAGVPHTFELLHRLAPDWDRYRSLRFLTQAGGRLDPGLVVHFARLGRRHGWRFHVMYGQTEGAPRLAHLPPHLAEQHPDTIGGAVPGGSLRVVDDRGVTIDDPGVEGELVYRGPNVMIGYARDRAELATREDLAELRTGDLAVRTVGGLFRITGRRARFVKPFGLRLSLDEIEGGLDRRLVAAVTGTDRRITVLVEHGTNPATRTDGPVDDLIAGLTDGLAARYRLPPAVFGVLRVDALPRLANGKVDYRAAAALATESGADGSRPASGPNGFLHRFVDELAAVLLGRTERAGTVEGAFAAVFPGQRIEDASTFLSLNGDSLRFVQLAVLLEPLLGPLPPTWPELMVADLRQRIGADHVAL